MNKVILALSAFMMLSSYASAAPLMSVGSFAADFGNPEICKIKAEQACTPYKGMPWQYAQCVNNYYDFCMRS